MTVVLWHHAKLSAPQKTLTEAVVQICSLRNFKKFTGKHLCQQSLFFNKVTGRKVVLRNFAIFTGKHLCQSLVFNKVAGLWHLYFPMNFAKFLRTHFLQNTSGDCFFTHSVWLLVHLWNKVTIATHKEWSFPLRISSVNVTKSAGSSSWSSRQGLETVLRTLRLILEKAK